MIRFVSGIILVVIAVLSSIGHLIGDSAADEPVKAILGVFIFAVGGALLIYFGKKSINIRKGIIEYSFNMLRESDAISAKRLAIRMGVSEIKVRKILNKNQRKGIIPYKAVIK